MDNLLHFRISFDSCAFDPKYWPENEAAQKLLELEEQEIIDILPSYSVIKEIDHPNTPPIVKEYAARMVHTLKPEELNSAQLKRLGEIESILAGNGNAETMQQDALHIFECARSSGQYFVTVDNGIYKKKDILRTLFNEQVEIIKPSELLKLISSERAHRNIS